MRNSEGARSLAWRSRPANEPMKFTLLRLLALLTILAACMAIAAGTHPLIAVHALAFYLMPFLCISFRDDRIRFETSSGWLTGYILLVMLVINVIGMSYMQLDLYIHGDHSQYIKFPPSTLPPITLYTVAPILVVMAFGSWCVGTVLERQRKGRASGG